MSVNKFDNYILTWCPDRSILKMPYYRALAEDLENKIRSGELAPGTKLPPQREIADYLDINFTTITKVYDLCKSKGLVEGFMGKGTFVSRRMPQDLSLAIAYAESKTIDMSSLCNFCDRSEIEEEAMRRIMDRMPMPEMFNYSNPMGMPHQLTAGVQWMDKLGVHADASRVMVTSGGQNALLIALLSLFLPGDYIAVEKYTYASIIEIAKMIHLHLIPIETDNQGMIPESLKEKCRKHSIKGIYLMPAFANPTTIVIPGKRRDELAEVIRDNGLILIEDDVASCYTITGGECERSMFDRLPGQCVYICGMSKSVSPGIRTAYLAFPANLEGRLRRGFSNINVKTSIIDAEIITELIVSEDIYKIIRQKIQACEKASTIYDRIFPSQLSKERSRELKRCSFRWLPIATDKNFSEVEEELLNKGVRVFHSERFSVDGSEREKFLRVSIGSAGNLRNLEKGLIILKDYLETTWG